MTGEQKPGGLEVVARYHAERLLDNIATATQNRALLTDDPAEDKVLTEAVIENAVQEFKAICAGTPGERADARLKELEVERDTAQSAVEAWANVCESLEAHLQDRIAMRDEASPERYLSILQSSMARVQRDSEQIRAARWADYRRLTARATAAEAKLAKAKEALEPFKKASEIRLCGEWRDDQRFAQTDVGFHLTFGDLRRAASVLAALQEAGEAG